MPVLRSGSVVAGDVRRHLRGVAFWERHWPLLGAVPVEDPEDLVRLVLIDDRLGSHAFYEVEAFADPYLAPAAYEAIDRVLCDVPDGFFMRWYLLQDEFGPVRPRPGTPLAGPAPSAVLGEAAVRGRRLRVVVEAAAYRQGFFARARDALFGLVRPSGRGPVEAVRAEVRDGIGRIRSAVRALRPFVALRPLDGPEAVRALSAVLGLPDVGSRTAEAVAAAWLRPEAEATRAVPGLLAGALPVGDAEDTPNGLWVLGPDGVWRIYRAVTVLDFFGDVLSDFWRYAAGELDFPFRAVVVVAPASQAFTLRQLRHRLNVAWNFSTWRVRATAVSADIAAEDAEAAYREILRKNFRVLRLGVTFLVWAEAPDRRRASEDRALEELRGRIDAVRRACDRRTARVHVEWLRQPYVFRSVLPGARDVDVVRARPTLPSVATNLLPIHLTRTRFRTDDDLVFYDRLWRPRTLRWFDPAYGIYSAVVSGRTRAGKSFFTNYLIDALSAREDVQVVVIDTSGSYVRTARARGFAVYDVRLGGDSAGVDITAGLRPDMKTEVLAAAALIASMADAEGHPVDPDEVARNLEHYVRTAPDPNFTDFIERTGALSRYGSFYRLAAPVVAPPPERRIDFSRRLVLVNVDPRLGYEAGEFARRFASVLSRALMLAFQKSVYTSPYTWKLFVKDESWADLSDPMMGTAYELAFRTFAKFKAGAVVLTQGLGDFYAKAAPGVADAVVGNAGRRLYFAQDWHEAMFRAGLGTTPEESRRIWTELGVHAVPGVYAEFLLQEAVTGDLEVLRVRVPEELYELYQTTHMEDVSGRAPAAGGPDRLARTPAGVRASPGPSGSEEEEDVKRRRKRKLPTDGEFVWPEPPPYPKPDPEDDLIRQVAAQYATPFPEGGIPEGYGIDRYVRSPGEAHRGRLLYGEVVPYGVPDDDRGRR